MQGIIMSLFWFSQGLGALVGVATMYGFVGKWFTSYDHGNINCSLDTKGQCHLNYYFYFVGGIQLFGMFAFGLASWSLNIGRTVPVRIQRRGITMVKPDRRDRDEEDETTTTPTTPPTQGYEDEDSVNRLRSRSDQSDGI
jgi:hypothetical protein